MSVATMCDPKAKFCAYIGGTESFLSCYSMLKTPGNENICLSQWKTQKITKDERVSTITVKREKTTDYNLNTDFQKRLFHFRCDVFNIKWQVDAYMELRSSFKHRKFLLHVILANISCECTHSRPVCTLESSTTSEWEPYTFCDITLQKTLSPFGPSSIQLWRWWENNTNKLAYLFFLSERFAT